ncbi:hypothetical protein, partial [uncultured Rikenella sp.]|uniref:hypothetical protein n=1 Tax=uncultured Rikenella sp. TaxID=368003 RepID=UPI0025F7B8C4
FLRPLLGPAQRENRKRFSRPKNRVRLTAAPLSLRRVFRRPRQCLPDWLAANRQNVPFYAGGRRKQILFARRTFILFRLIAETVESHL